MTDRTNSPAETTSRVPGTDTAAFAAKDLLSAETSMDAVTLHVADLDLMTRYYRDALSLAVLTPSDALLAAIPGAGAGSRDETVVLGRGATPLVVLRRGQDLPRARRGEAGLFHTALLFDDAPALAAAVASVARTAPSTFVGSGDHLVSEAFYFTDPEGNGVELYHDRPRETWTWQDGQVAMDTLYIDPNAFMQEHLTDAALERALSTDVVGPDDTVVGHVHLQVGDIATAREFYVDTLGFEATASLPSALFVSAGGYHHHMAMNTWNSQGAGPRASTLGLGQVAISVPSEDDVTALVDRLSRRGIQMRHDGATLRFDDPWKNLIEVAVR
ncbi:VOC family protein [Oerskovia sp. Sa2CUA9]|uniref:VOC family protein n=2 Tax=Oerskovia merdavium TaxID=2762227 RepID=A0ABR8TZT9_9CELL|nr:VOC family protein [Oerskovia merdavium]